MWVTTSFANAAGYAKRHENGSEALNFLLDGIAALEFLKEPSPRDLLSRYPKLQEVLALPHQPVVLALSGVDPERIRSDRDEAMRWEPFFNLSEALTNGYHPSFRLIEPKASNVMGICSLEGYNPGGRGHIPAEEDVQFLDPINWLQTIAAPASA